MNIQNTQINRHLIHLQQKLQTVKSYTIHWDMKIYHLYPLFLNQKNTCFFLKEQKHILVKNLFKVQALASNTFSPSFMQFVNTKCSQYYNMLTGGVYESTSDLSLYTWLIICFKTLRILVLIIEILPVCWDLNYLKFKRCY